MKKILPLLCLLLAACSTPGSGTPESYLQGRKIPPSVPEEIHHCHGYGCMYVTPVHLGKKDWQQVAKIFKKKPKSAAQERERIAQAIGLLEQKIGPLDGTAHDEPGTFRKTGRDQLDCVDESTNTTTYLGIFQDQGFLKFHIVNAPTMRLPIINAGRWPHQTAVITDTQTRIPWAVDSWFGNNGDPADIIELETWKQGWKPASVHGLL